MTTRTPNAHDIAIAKRVREFRLARNVPQEKMGEALGVSFQQVQKYENGKNRISAGQLQRIADVLDVPVASFYERSADAPAALRGSWKLPHGNKAISRSENHRLIAREDVAREIAAAASALARKGHAAGFDTLGRILDLAAIEARAHIEKRPSSARSKSSDARN